MIIFGAVREMKLMDPAMQPSAFYGSRRIACFHFEDHLVRIPQDYQPCDGFCIYHLQPLKESQPLSLIISLAPQSPGKELIICPLGFKIRPPEPAFPRLTFEAPSKNKEKEF